MLEPGADACPYPVGIFADAATEDDRRRLTGHGKVLPDVLTDAITEHLKRQTGVRIAGIDGSRHVSQVPRDARDAQQPGTLIQDELNLLRADSLAFAKQRHDGRIEIA